MPLKKLEREKREEQHLFYTSLKYTKTGELMVSVIKKMAEVVAFSLQIALEHAKKRKLIKAVPKTPLEQLELIKKLFKKEKAIVDFLGFYEKMRNIDKYKKVTESEFRKGLTMKIFVNEEIITLDMTKFSEIQGKFENFLKAIETFIRTK